MTAEELRIGNWVKLGNNSLFKPEFIGSYYQFTIGDFVHAEYYQPIPLTPEILEKAGFVYDGCTFSIGGFMLAKGAIQWQVWLNGLHAGETTRINYVHELQNLFYCVNGYELHINL